MRLLVIVLLIVISANAEIEKPYQLNEYIYKVRDLVVNSTAKVTTKLKSLYHDTTTQIKDFFGESRNKIQETSSKFARKVKSSVTFCEGHSPRESFTTQQLIASDGYPAESHDIITEDGYILTVHRIPFWKNGKPVLNPKTVLLHHGLLGSSADWVLAGPNRSLAYVLSDMGYDVWLANARGNTYSRAHLTFPIDSHNFWNFSWHEIAQWDLPAVIEYIHRYKGEVELNYIGHSMGTTLLFVLLSTKPEYNKKLRYGFALAPVAYMSQIRSPLHEFAPYTTQIDYLFKLLGVDEFLPQSWYLKELSKHACEINHIEEIVCENSMFVLCGNDPAQFNKSMLPMILSHIPAGASTKCIIHYAQEIRANGNFQNYDYGKEENLRRYGTEMPPSYNLSKISLPIALFSAHNDWLAGTRDVAKLYAQLPNRIEHFVVPLESFNHIDFMWAIDAPKILFNKIVELLAKPVKP